jgi:hypothetical protein
MLLAEGVHTGGNTLNRFCQIGFWITPGFFQFREQGDRASLSNSSSVFAASSSEPIRSGLGSLEVNTGSAPPALYPQPSSLVVHRLRWDPMWYGLSENLARTIASGFLQQEIHLFPVSIFHQRCQYPEEYVPQEVLQRADLVERAGVDHARDQMTHFLWLTHRL